MKIKALSIWEPWATLMRLGAKTIETRSWSTSYRGPLLICAAKKRVSKNMHHRGGAMSLCEWEPCLGRPASEIEGVSGSRIGCRAEAVLSLGYDGDWRLCASCAELPRFRRYRVATVIGKGIRLRRDRAGWWIDGELVRPAPLAEVLARVDVLE